MVPVSVPPLAKGEDARAALAETRAALSEANGRLRATRGWYDTVRSRYAGGKTGE
jgi:hypothetical protein